MPYKEELNMMSMTEGQLSSTSEQINEIHIIKDE